MPVHFPVNNTDLNFNLSFNFSLLQALDVLEEHYSNDKIFGYETETVIIASYTILMAIGLCSNLLVCSVIMANNKIRSSRNILIINLNMSDIILCVFCMPFTLMVIIRRSWFMGAFLCKMVPFVQASTIFVSAATVLAIAIDRHNKIIKLNKNFPKENRREMFISASLIWLSALLLSIPICIFQNTVPVGLPGLHLYYKCVELWPSSTFKGVYTLLTLIFQFVTPSITLLITHIHIRTHLNEKIIKTDSDASSMDNASVHNERFQRDLRRNTRATMVLLLISVVFTVSWLPWNVLNLLAEFHPNIMEPKHLYLSFAVCHMTAMTSSISNPILYGWLNSNIRREMVRMGCVIAKVSSALVSNRSSQTDNMRAHQNSQMRSSNGESSNYRSNHNTESQV